MQNVVLAESGEPHTLYKLISLRLGQIWSNVGSRISKIKKARTGLFPPISTLGDLFMNGSTALRAWLVRIDRGVCSYCPLIVSQALGFGLI